MSAPPGHRPAAAPTRAVDLNADLGEGFGVWVLGDDEALLDVVSSANVACGFHAGDPDILRRVCARAAERGVAVGAQVSYRDLAGFGRRSIDVEPGSLTNDLLYQIGALDAFARVAGTRVRYVKPHGALYNRVVHDEEQAAAVVAAVALYDQVLPVLGLPGSALLRHAADTGLTAVPEAFADRGYTAAGTLVPRRQPGALLSDAAAVAARTVRMVTENRVVSVEGTDVGLDVRSVCVHGDSPGAAAMAVAVRDALQRAGVQVRPFAP